MFTETFKYEDWNGNKREETHYFHLTESKITELNFKISGGLQGYIKAISEIQDEAKLADLVKGMIIRSYGVKSEDGRYFDQSPEVITKFMQTPMFDQLYMRMATDTDYTIKFLIGILPANIQKDINESQLKLDVKKAMADGTIPSTNNENKS